MTLCFKNAIMHSREKALGCRGEGFWTEDNRRMLVISGNRNEVKERNIG